MPTLLFKLANQQHDDLPKSHPLPRGCEIVELECVYTTSKFKLVKTSDLIDSVRWLDYIEITYDQFDIDKVKAISTIKRIMVKSLYIDGVKFFPL